MFISSAMWPSDAITLISLISMKYFMARSLINCWLNYLLLIYTWVSYMVASTSLTSVCQARLTSVLVYVGCHRAFHNEYVGLAFGRARL